MKKILLLMICQILFSACYADVISGKINHNDMNYKNKIIDSKTGQPIDRAKITIPEINFTTYTDSNGFFKLNVDVNDQMIMFVEHDGYKVFSLAVDNSTFNTPLKLGIEQSSPFDMQISEGVIHLGDNMYSSNSANSSDFRLSANSHYLSKVFKKPIRGEGLKGMIKTLFSRKYTPIPAVNGISFDIKQGEIVGYIGANGAGKSTTIKMMCGILHPTSGEIVIDGKNFQKHRKEINKEMGVVFGQKTQLWWDIPLIETFKILKVIYNVSDEDYNERFNYLCELLDLNSFITQNVRSLSLGQRMRADFAAALIHSPKIVYLDEPTIGLDVLVKDKIRKAIKELNKKYNITVILTTHDMKDIEELCNRIIIIDKGKILYDGTLKDIKYQFGNTKTIVIPNKYDLTETLNKFPAITTEVEEDKMSLKFSLNEVNLDDLLLELINVYHVEDFKINDISIEDITKALYEKISG
jgi:ABC-2 type transport system ATP-binding protein